MSAVKTFKRFRELLDVNWAGVNDGDLLFRSGNSVAGLSLAAPPIIGATTPNEGNFSLLTVSAGSALAPSVRSTSSTKTGLWFAGQVVRTSHNGSAGVYFDVNDFRFFGTAPQIVLGSAQDLKVCYDAANVLAIRNGVSASEFRTYRTFTDTANYERIALRPNAYGLLDWALVSEASGTGAVRGLFLDGSRVQIRTASGTVWRFDTTGHLLSGLDNTYDIGDPTHRPRSGYLGTSLVVGGAAALTASAPVLDLSQTWNNGAVFFTGLKLNITNTASATNSDILWLGVNSPVLQVKTNGLFMFGASTSFSPGAQFWNQNYIAAGRGLVMNWGNSGGFGAGSSILFGNDLVLTWDAANTIALRNGTNAQTFNIYNTYTDASNYERLLIGWSANSVLIKTDKLGTGIARDIILNSSGNLFFGCGNLSRMFLSTSTGGLLFNVDNTCDIGTSGANRPRNIYAAGDIRCGAGIVASNQVSVGGGNVNLNANGIGKLTLLNNLNTDFSLLQFGGTSNLFPSLKRSTTGLIARLADDSADTWLQASYITLTALPTSDPGVAGRLWNSAGTVKISAG